MIGAQWANLGLSYQISEEQISGRARLWFSVTSTNLLLCRPRRAKIHLRCPPFTNLFWRPMAISPRVRKSIRETNREFWFSVPEALLTGMWADLLSLSPLRRISHGLVLWCQNIVFCSHRHLLNDIYTLLPHSRKDAKLDTKTKLYQLNELAELYNCNNVLFFEARKGKDLYIWMSKPPNGPTVKMHLQNRNPPTLQSPGAPPTKCEFSPGLIEIY